MYKVSSEVLKNTYSQLCDYETILMIRVAVQRNSKSKKELSALRKSKLEIENYLYPEKQLGYKP